MPVSERIAPILYGSPAAVVSLVSALPEDEPHAVTESAKAATIASSVSLRIPPIVHSVLRSSTRRAGARAGPGGSVWSPTSPASRRRP